jgi:hypothetical protein
MAIKDKYYNPDRFRSVRNLHSFYVTRTHKPEVIIGNTPDIGTCTRLYKDRILHNWPSQWHSRYPGGYIIFAGGNKYDRKRQRVNGEEEFIFRMTEDTEIIFQKHNLKGKIIAMLDIASDEELRVVSELFCERAGQQCKEWWWRDSAEEYILSRLEAIGLQELHDLAALLEGRANSASPEVPEGRLDLDWRARSREKSWGAQACAPAFRSAYLPLANRFSISSQFTTFHQAARYSGRRFWYLR